MKVQLERVEAGCPGNPDRVHAWGLFEGGRGCLFCSAWHAFPPRTETADPLPTRFPAFHHDDPLYRPYGARVTEPIDVDIEVMAELLPVVDSTRVTYGELEQLARRVIEIVRG